MHPLRTLKLFQGDAFVYTLLDGVTIMKRRFSFTTLLTSILLATWTGCVQGTAQSDDTKQGSTLSRDADQAFVATSFAGRFDEALEHAKKDRHSFIIYLATTQPSSTITALEKYVTDPDYSIRCAVLTGAETVGTNKNNKTEDLKIARRILITFCGDKDLKFKAVSSLFGIYNRERTVATVDVELKKPLLDYLETESPQLVPILLLSSCNKDSDIIAVLRKISLRHGQSQSRVLAPGGPGDGVRPTVLVSFCVNLALARIGDKEGIENVAKTIKRGRVDDVLFACDLIRWVDHPDLIEPLATFLDDTRIARSQKGSESIVEARIRLCDIVFHAIAYKLQHEQYLVSLPYDPVTDEQLALAKQWVSEYLKEQRK